MPAATGYGLAKTFDHLNDGPKLGIELWWWAAWFAGLVATLVPNPISLTAIRILAPASTAACLVAGFVGDRWPTALIVSVAWSLLVTTIAFMPTTGDPMINGSAYGSERRMALRAPGFALVGPIQLAWLLAAIGLLAPPLAMAANAGLIIILALVFAGGALWVSGKMLHQLAQRWIVFVPAGFVVHDPVQLLDAVLLRRSAIATFGPAVDVGTDAEIDRTDLTGGAIGLALGVDLVEPTEITLRRSGLSSSDQTAKLIKTAALVFTPSLPGALLTEARVRGIKIGAASSGAHPIHPIGDEDG